MKLSPEKEIFMTDLISRCIKSFSLVSFNQMFWRMNKIHTGKKLWNLWWTYSHGGTTDANAWEKEYLPEFHAKLKRVFIQALYEVKNPASQIVAVFRKSQQSRTLQFVFFLKCRLKMFMIIHNVAQLSNTFFSWAPRFAYEIFSVPLSILILLGDCYEYRNFYFAHFRQGIVMSFRAGIVSDVMGVLWNGGGPRHSASNVSVMLLPVCRSSSLGDVNFVAFTGKPLERSVYLIYSN